MGVDLMHEQLSPFGFGRRVGIDLEGEVTGLLPSTDWKRRNYKKPEQQRWYAGETISLGIGQGYNNFTMLQMATATATLVSGGQRFRPRLVREIEDVVTHQRKRVASDALDPLPLQADHVELINKALHGVTQEGTSTRVFLGAPYKSGGKTGTAQAVGIRQNERYNAARMEEHQRDHSLYIAMAPMEQPTIALAVVVENAGFGSEAAAPIARRVFDYVLLGQVPSDEDMAATRIGKSGPPMGTPRRAADLPLPGSALSPVAQAAPTPVARLAALAASGGPAVSVVFEQPSPWQRLRPVFSGLRPAADAGHADAGRHRPGHHVFGRLRPRHALRRPWPQHAAGAGCAVRGGPGTAAEAAAPGGAAVRGGRRAAGGDGPAGHRHHQEGRHALAQCRHRDPAQRDPQDRRAADAGLVVPEARRAAARDRLPGGRRAAAAAGGAGGQAARPGHVAADPVRRPLRDLLRRPVLAPGAAGAAAGCGGHQRRGAGRTHDLRRRCALAGAARIPAAPHLHPARPVARPAGQGLPHHPGHDRHRLRRHHGQGLHERHADAPGVHPRAHHRLHLRRLLRRVRAWLARRC